MTIDAVPRSRWLALWAVAAVVSVAAVAAYVLLVRTPHEMDQARRDVAQELGRVADTRHSMIDLWIRDAVADAGTVADFPSTLLVMQAAVGPAGAADPRLPEILTSFARQQRYEQLSLMGVGGEPLLHSRGAHLTEACRRASLAALSAGAPAIDLHDHADRPLAAIAVPVIDARVPLGAVLVEAPLSAFAALLEARPMNGGEAAVALFAHERSANGPRAITIGPQPVSITSLADPDLGSGLPVIAAIRELEEAPWAFVIALPRELVDGPVRQRMRRIAALWSALAGAAFLVVLLLLWTRELSLRAALSRERAELMLLLDNASDAVLFADATGRIRHCNARAEQLYGRSAREFAGKHGIRDLRPEREHVRGERQLETVLREGRLVFETVHLTANGREVPVEISANRVTLGTDHWVVAVVRDITDRKAADARIQRLNRLLRTMSAVRQAIAADTDRDPLLAAVCRIAVDTGGFELAWIGYADADGRVAPLALAGPAADYASGLDARWDDTALGHGPVGAAVRDRRTVVIRNVTDDTRMAPWRERLLARSLLSVASSPIVVRGQVFGAVSLYAGEPDAFDDEAIGLVEELAADIGLALERDEQRTELAEQASRYRALLSTSLEGIVVLDREGRVVEANESFCRMLGYGPDDPGPQSVLDWAVGLTEEQIRAAGEGPGDTSMLVEAEQRRRDGTRISVEISVACVTIGGKRLVYCAQRDVTERNRAAEALRRSEAQFRAVFDYAGLGIGLTDLEGRPIRVNRAFERMTGYTEAELQQRRFPDYTHPDDLAAELPQFESLLRGEGEHYEIDKRYIHRNGSLIWVTLTVSLVRDRAGDPQFFVVLADDITERRKLQEQFLQAQKMEGIGRLAGGIAHDFNNLLTAIMGYTELLRADLPPDHPGQSFVDEVNKASGRAAALTTQLLAFARKQVIEPRPLDLNAVVRDAGKMLRRLVGEDVEIVFQPAADLGVIEADPGQLDQILVNLSVNARDAMPRGGQLIIETENAVLDEHYARSHVDVTPGEYVMLAVSDTGEGMTDDVQAKLFEPFFTTKEQGKGTGLGLATCHGIVKQAGGSIHVYSEPGLGTTFRIYLPRVQRAVAPDVERPPAPALRGGHETVLLAEDEEAVRGLAALSLRSHGYRVLEAANGAEALALAQTHRDDIALLVTDVVMPVMNGRELARRFQEIRPDAGVLFMSGHAESAIVHHGVLESGMAFLPKPFTPERLARRVRELLDAHAGRVPGADDGPSAAGSQPV